MKKTVVTRDDGFTFAETLAVLAIMLVLSAGVGISAMKYVEKARKLEARSQIQIYTLALQSYWMDCGAYPTTSQGLQALWEKPVLHPLPKNWNGPYITREVQADPWGNKYVYRCVKGGKLPFVITSYGADGREGGTGNEEDIVSWQ